MTQHRNVIVHIGTSADGYIARPDGDLEWLTSRPKPAGFYGMSAFMKSIDTKVLGRKTYEHSLRMGARFDATKGRTIVFSRHASQADAPSGVEFVSGEIGPFVSHHGTVPNRPSGRIICVPFGSLRAAPGDVTGTGAVVDGPCVGAAPVAAAGAA